MKFLKLFRPKTKTKEHDVRELQRLLAKTRPSTKERKERQLREVLEDVSGVGGQVPQRWGQGACTARVQKVGAMGEAAQREPTQAEGGIAYIAKAIRETVGEYGQEGRCYGAVRMVRETGGAERQLRSGYSQEGQATRVQRL